MDGIIPLYKERGMTSFDCVSRLRRILHTKKIGHSGTLDPNVDGVLPICVGQATKVVEFLMASGKQYVGELLVGEATTTQDLDGEVVAQKPVTAPIAEDTIRKAMQELTGDIVQIPPMYSAIKVNGKKLYEYARAGETVERPKRHVHIERFEMTASSYDEKNQQQRIRFVVDCSKGTYVRTLAYDLAKELGYPGVMSSLTRTKSGGFELDQTLSLTDIQDAMEAQIMNRYVYPMDYALKSYPHAELSDAQWKRVQNGGWLSDLDTKDQEVALTYQGEVKALYQLKDHVYKPLKMLSTK
ncbi:tRNA pseudouridine(55) synthase TruB [Limosilactobacillus mucosae]|uniref:tRNA pseudouridine synthase B n=1 Tax=Limosilactobacillus mucosae TaxID=97478 RepID=A0AAJ1M9H1_LIMMU|nr:tRNA pseudouridine(55) synthase TruB [Limosilactobacillus mucosae]MDC2830352.1 tRNA pseudouridine(55) synthase TruB [Limosilactobacillus mucosae]MDC2837926.1 tRNA pseudouridine(55) synthase TruB [Limosilactobacillus mucosae]MDC2849939.1 tRNA pseudouridine(55) synthase TruB [Limosilactobacillus mucosae]MDC2854157.1 tRNA pseudouridine(55) synthase TruB [Limosilactobacillus mucosae]